jgi:chitin disaccharide deacetylase
MERARTLFVVADDFGIGPETDRGILTVAEAGRLTATVLLVNTPYAEAAVRDWNRAGRPMAVGWHPNLTLDAPVLPPERVPSLVGPDGRFHRLGKFLKKALFGRLDKAELAAELAAQHRRFVELVGHPPLVVNTHQHVGIFPPVGRVLLDLLDAQPGPKPYVRRVREQKRLLLRVPGARVKRGVLSWFGKRFARRSAARGFPGADWLIGITDPPCTTDDRFWTRWISKANGETVELGCHPGYTDQTLLVRDVPGKKYDLARRVNELDMMLRDDFLEAADAAGFRIAPPSVFEVPELARAAA